MRLSLSYLQAKSVVCATKKDSLNINIVLKTEEVRSHTHTHTQKVTSRRVAADKSEFLTSTYSISGRCSRSLCVFGFSQNDLLLYGTAKMYLDILVIYVSSFKRKMYVRLERGVFLLDFLCFKD